MREEATATRSLLGLEKRSEGLKIDVSEKYVASYHLVHSRRK
jgi:hypothetical protein